MRHNDSVPKIKCQSKRFCCFPEVCIKEKTHIERPLRLLTFNMSQEEKEKRKKRLPYPLRKIKERKAER